MKISSQTVATDAAEWRRLPPTRMNGYLRDKDDIVSHSLVQKTYARLHDVYAQRLCENWAEEAEPSKHVFDDLATAAFVIELWRRLYGVSPTSEAAQTSGSAETFPGFVDIACGNGVLVYVLVMEGYRGTGFDAHRRRSWGTFPEVVQDRLVEKIIVPKPFMDVLESDEIGVGAGLDDYPKGTFVISNHADELTVWTPLMAGLACPAFPFPFLIIPCCSHSLSGDKHRYAPPGAVNASEEVKGNGCQTGLSTNQDSQPASGDLRALRWLKQKEKTEEGFATSMYGSLTAKTIDVAKEIGYEIQTTRLQIPSTRNMGIVGSRVLNLETEGLQQKIVEIVRRECERDGGIQDAAVKWLERAQNLHRGDGGRDTILH